MINFPNLPRRGEIYRESGSTFQWNGSVWNPVGLRSTDIENASVTAARLATTNSGTLNQVLALTDSAMEWRNPPVASINDPNLYSGLLCSASNDNVTVGTGYAAATDGSTLLVNEQSRTINNVADNAWVWLVYTPATGNYALATSNSKTTLPSGHTVGRAVCQKTRSDFTMSGSGTGKTLSYQETTSWSVSGGTTTVTLRHGDTSNSGTVRFNGSGSWRTTVSISTTLSNRPHMRWSFNGRSGSTNASVSVSGTGNRSLTATVRFTSHSGLVTGSGFRFSVRSNSGSDTYNRTQYQDLSI